MEPWLMIVVGGGILLLPLLLRRLFNGADVADSRGRRRNRQWAVRRHPKI